MDEHNSQMVTQEEHDSSRIAESLWSFIHTPVVTVLTDYKNEMAEPMLHSLLESLIKRSSNLKLVLLPSDPNVFNTDLFQHYDAFTVWLFGAMFYVTGNPLSERTFNYSINIQASMLTTLSIHNIVTFKKICEFYMSMLKDLQCYIIKNNCSYMNDIITLNRFLVIEDIIPGLKLTSYPVILNINNVKFGVQSILEIIIESGVSNWNNEELWNVLLVLIQISDPHLVLKILKLGLHMLYYVDEPNFHISSFVNFVTGILQIIPVWFSSGHIDEIILNEYFKTFLKLINELFVTQEVNKFSYEIIEFLVNNEYIVSRIDKDVLKNLRNEICTKIKRYLIKEPRACTIDEAKKFVLYFKFCPEFILVFMCYIYFEIDEVSHLYSPVIMYKISDTWKQLVHHLYHTLASKMFTETLRILCGSLILEDWTIEQKLDVILYENEFKLILEKLKKKILVNSDVKRTFLLQSMLLLTCHQECKEDFVEIFITLPFLEYFKELDDNQKIINIIQMFDQEMKISALKIICTYGNKKNILTIIREFIIKKNLELAVVGIECSIALMKNCQLKLRDICKFILDPALLSNDQLIQCALAKTLSTIVCYLAGGFDIYRELQNMMCLSTKCKYCIENLHDLNEDTFYVSSFIEDYEEELLTAYFQLFKSVFIEVRILMSQNFINFTNHMRSFSSNNIAQFWLPYVSDNNEDVRQNLATIIGNILNIRIEQAKKTGANLVDEIPPDLKEFVNLVINAMMETLNLALETSDSDLILNTLLETARNFGCTPLYATERKIAYIFLLIILHPNSSPAIVTVAINAYKELASFLNIKPKMLFIRYKRKFLTLMVRQAFLNYYNFSYNISTSLHRAAKCIGYAGSHELISKEGHNVICYLLPFILDVTIRDGFLPDIAELLGTSVKQMLIEYFPHICSYIFLNIPLEMGLVCFQNIALLTETSIQELATNSFVVIFENLMLNFHNTPDKIIGFLRILSQFDTAAIPDLNSKENINSYLKFRLHGILVKYDVNLSSKSDEWTQKTALASLATLMRFMGAEHITIFRFKILATLRGLLQFKRPGFGPLICDAWDAFINNIPMKDLGPLIPTICIFMIPLLANNYYEKVSKMLEFLLHKNDIISNYISELFFIDDLKTPTHISDIIKTQILQTQPKGFAENLQLWLKRITHETDEIRMLALHHLKKFLTEHRVELNEMILSDTDVHPSIVELLDTLLKGCQEKDENIRLLYGECLGELGAIEPSLLPRRIISRENSNFICDMNKEFACAMLSENVRAFQMQKSTQNMDCFALAIQEILKAYDIRPEGKKSNLWNNLPSTMKQIIFPFLTSHYSITIKSDISAFPRPIYGSEAGSSVEEWAYNWLCSISSYLNDSTLCNMMLACRPAFKRDIKTIIFALPYVVAYIVANATEEYIHDELRAEMLAVINIREQPTLNQELFLHRPLRSDNNIKMNDKQMSDEARRMRCSQIVFSILDHLQRWLREQRLHRDNKFKSIQTFCSKLDNLVIAEGCYRSQEFHRALMYLEQHIASSGKTLSEVDEEDLLSKIYAKLDEPDGVSGNLVSRKKKPLLNQLLLAHEVSGDLQDAAICYEKLAQKEVFSFKYFQGMIKCYIGLNQSFTASYIASALLSYRPELEPLIIDNEPFWNLAQGTCENELQNHKNADLTRILLRDLERGIKPDFSTTKKKLVSLLEVASRPGGYQQAYAYIMKLHVLNEFDKATSLMITDVKKVPSIFEEWDKRSQLLSTSRGIEFVLGMRRAILNIALELHDRVEYEEDDSQIKQEIGKFWLKSAKIARKTGFLQQSYMHILSAAEFCPPEEVAIEQAQLYWVKGNREQAFTTLKHSFTSHYKPAAVYKQMSLKECVEERKQCAKAKLLFARYNDQTLNVDTDISITNYKEAIEVWRAWEKSLLACAQYYDSVVNRMTDDEKDIKGRDLQVHMMNYYGKSLMYGCKYIHQSMPRMLTIWLDFASRIAASRSSHAEIEYISLRQDSLLKMTKIMDVYSERLPLFMWLTAFSQLVSRICHPSKEVQQTLCALLVKLIIAYPQHCLWMMASVINSSVPIRQRRCQEILNHSKLKTTEMITLIKDFNNLWERLIELSNKHINDRIQNITVNQLSRNLPRLFTNPNFSKIMIPATKFRQLNLPSKNASLDNHNPFSSNFVHIMGIENNVVIMKSLQKPRRIELKGSDGNKYLFMCKPKDDLRIDFRLMEFNDIVNKYLQKNPESRQRRLYIRTYSVVPLNEECGLIEWIPNLIGLRPILVNTYEEMGIILLNKELKQILCSLNDPLAKKKEVFLNKLLPRHPPVLGEWFRLTFPDPYGWYEARTTYIRTTAVMSMVGYILGLGDRHGENILFDSKCGDCVHVDFNCLFNRGELLDWAERVPFRLTHNMIDAMGPLGVEGPFRLACQITMSVLREQSSTLLSVLTPFVYDPLVSWNKNQTGAAGEKPNEKAVEHIYNINRRLKGLVRSQGKKLENIALNLSVSGQVNQLILDATNVDNLCQMYFGWGAYM